MRLLPVAILSSLTPFPFLGYFPYFRSVPSITILLALDLLLTDSPFPNKYIGFWYYICSFMTSFNSIPIIFLLHKKSTILSLSPLSINLLSLSPLSINLPALKSKCIMIIRPFCSIFPCREAFPNLACSTGLWLQLPPPVPNNCGAPDGVNYNNTSEGCSAEEG